MPILFPDLPQETRKFFVKHLSKMEPLYLERRDDHSLGGHFSSEDLRLPMQVFTTEVSSFQREPAGFSPVEHGWLAFIGETLPSRTAEIAVVEEPGSKRMVFLGLSSGPQINDIGRQIEVLQYESSLNGMSLVCRLLRIQALNLATIWLKAFDPRNDVFMPLVPVWAPFQQTLYRTSQFISTLAEAEKNKVRSAKVLFRKQS